MLAIEMSATNPDLLLQFAEQTAQKLKTTPDIEVLGPAEAYIARIKGQHRLQIILKGSTPASLRKALERAIPPGKTPVQIRIDMDPQSLL
jgi:primosomal protein N' (replication factor Y)